MELLEEVSRRLCSDPRDPVFVLRSIYEYMQDFSPNTAISVDVNHSQDVADLFTHVMKRALLQNGGVAAWTRSLSVLKHWGVIIEAQPWRISLPLWVPDWTCGTRLDRFALDIYSAGGPGHHSMSPNMFSNDEKRLMLQESSIDNTRDVYIL